MFIYPVISVYCPVNVLLNRPTRISHIYSSVQNAHVHDKSTESRHFLLSFFFALCAELAEFKRLSYRTLKSLEELQEDEKFWAILSPIAKWVRGRLGSSWASMKLM